MGTTTREERLAKLAGYNMARSTRGEAKPPRDEFEETTAKPIPRKPANPETILARRESDCLLAHG